jgi:DNA repair exonuclease SbcCD nuclease subunit
MIKILHSGDWHLDAPLQGRPQGEWLRRELEKIPGKIARICTAEGCDLMLLSGDLFDGPYTRSSYRAVYEALESVQIPVFIAPGNHDYMNPDSPYEKEVWPENVYIFTKQQIRWVDAPGLSCRVYGAGF